MLLTESRTADFIEWLLTTGRGPIADVMRDRARWLADKWRRGQSTRKTRRYDVARWLENEIADAWTLRTDQQTKSMVLRQAAMELLAQADTIHVLDISEIARFIYTTY